MEEKSIFDFMKHLDNPCIYSKYENIHNDDNNLLSNIISCIVLSTNHPNGNKEYITIFEKLLELKLDPNEMSKSSNIQIYEILPLSLTIYYLSKYYNSEIIKNTMIYVIKLLNDYNADINIVFNDIIEQIRFDTLLSFEIINLIIDIFSETLNVNIFFINNLINYIKLNNEYKDKMQLLLVRFITEVHCNIDIDKIKFLFTQEYIDKFEQILICNSNLDKFKYISAHGERSIINYEKERFIVPENYHLFILVKTGTTLDYTAMLLFNNGLNKKNKCDLLQLITEPNDTKIKQIEKKIYTDGFVKQYYSTNKLDKRINIELNDDYMLYNNNFNIINFFDIKIIDLIKHYWHDNFKFYINRYHLFTNETNIASFLLKYNITDNSLLKKHLMVFYKFMLDNKSNYVTINDYIIFNDFAIANNFIVNKLNFNQSYYDLFVNKYSLQLRLYSSGDSAPNIALQFYGRYNKNLKFIPGIYNAPSHNSSLAYYIGDKIYEKNESLYIDKLTKNESIGLKTILNEFNKEKNIMIVATCNVFDVSTQHNTEGIIKLYRQKSMIFKNYGGSSNYYYKYMKYKQKYQNLKQ